MMQESSHRELSFRKNSFGRFARQHDITSEAEPVDPLGIVAPHYLKEAKIFLVVLHKGERDFNFQVVFDSYRTTLPNVEDLLEYVTNQAAIFEKVTDQNLESFARYIKRPLNVARAYLKDVRFAIPPFKIFLGPETYREFIQITEGRGPLPQ